jgi:hypothetical protein
MIAATFWEQGGTYLAVLTPLVAVPLSVLTFYLRAVRDGQMKGQVDADRRFERVDAAIAQLRQSVAEVVRDYATKEEWLRECMHARRRIEELSETVTRLEAVVNCRGSGASRGGEPAVG